MFVSDELVVSVGLEASSVAGLSNPQLPELQGTGAGVGCETVVPSRRRLCHHFRDPVRYLKQARDTVFTELSEIFCLTVPSEVLNYTSENFRDIQDFSCVFSDSSAG